MAEQKKAASFADLEKADGVEYDYVDAYGITVKIGSLTSADMLEWVEANEDKDKRKQAGLRMLVKSIVDEEGNRLPGIDTPEGFDKHLGVFRRKSSTGNSKVIRACLDLNGLGDAKAPNVSSEVATDTSSTDSPAS